MSVEIEIDDIHCDHCEQTIKEALESVDGVERASADQTSNIAKVEGNAEIDALEQAVHDAGYKPV